MTVCFTKVNKENDQLVSSKIRNVELTKGNITPGLKGKHNIPANIVTLISTQFTYKEEMN